MRKILSIFAVLILIVSMATVLISCEENTYDIVFTVDGQTYHTVKSVGYCETVLPEAPTKDGHTFAGWFYDDGTFLKEFTAASTLSSPVFENITLYAKWVKTEDPNTDPVTEPDITGVTFDDVTATYTGSEISLKLNGAPSGATVTYTGTVSAVNAGTYTATATVELAGYKSLSLTATLTINKAVYDMSGITFPDGTFVFDGEEKSIFIVGDLPDGVTVEYEGNGNGTIGVHSVTATFAGDAANYEPIAPLTASFTITEQPTVTHTVKFETNCDDTIGDVTVVSGEAVDAPIALQKAGFSFEGWYNGEKLWNFEEDTVTSDITLVAVWTTVEYTITYETYGGQNAQENPSSYNINSLTITLTSPKRAGYEFAGWYTDPEFNDAITEIAHGSMQNYVIYAKWNVIKYQIEYVTGDVNSTGENPTEYTVETPNITLQAATKTGYNFDGWYLDAAFTTKITVIDTSSAQNYTLHAKWSAADYKITYITNGGVNPSSNPTGYKTTDAVTSFSDAERNGYKFDGWYTDAQFKSAITSIPKGSVGDYTLYAKWSLITYNINYVSDGDITNSNPSTYNIESANITLATPVRAGYVFDGWYDNASFTGNRILTIPTGSSGNKTFYAKWSAASHSISYVLNGGVNNQANVASYLTGASVTFYAPTRSGYEFKGWYTDAAFTSSITAISAGSMQDYTLYAKWVPITYTITYVSDGDITNTNPTTYTCESAKITLTAPTRKGYKFEGWYDNAQLSGYQVSAIYTNSTGNKTLYAKWSLESYTVTYELNGGVNNAQNITSYSFGTSFTFLPPTKEGYEFKGWFTDAAFTASISAITASTAEDLLIYAKWAPITYTITYVSDGDITNTNPTTYTYESAKITLTAPTRKGYKFEGWYDNAQFNGYKINAIYAKSTDDKTFYAKWSLEVYTITYITEGTMDNSSNPTTYTYESAKITLATPSRDGYAFEGWYDNPDFSGYKINAIYAKSTDNKTFYARWSVAKQYTVNYNLNGGVNSTKNPSTFSVVSDGTLYDPTYERHYFLGWYTDAAFTNKVTAIDVMKAGDITLYAKWEDVVIKYSDFGTVIKYADLTKFTKIVGDGKTDDFLAIINAHEWANQYAMKICADAGKTYYIGEHAKTAIIKTDVDWTGASFIIDDRSIGPNEAARNSEIFHISPSRSATTYRHITSLSSGQTNIGMTFDSDVMLRVTAVSSDKIYIRYGGNANDGSARSEVLFVHADGTVDESTPIMWNYANVSSIIAYPQEAKKLYVTGGTFTTRANQYDASVYKLYKYYARGLKISRSNVVVDGVEHYITDEQPDGTRQGGYPYNGFFNTTCCNNVLIQNCVMTGHVAYQEDRDLNGNGTMESNELGAGTTMGTYDIIASYANDITWKNCTQSNNIKDRTYWGVMGSNFCKNMTYDGCKLSRFDAHCGVWNATIVNSEIGFTISLIGGGTARIENTVKHAGLTFIELRTDYGSTWQGDVYINDCTFYPYNNDTNGDKIADAPYTSGGGAKQAFLFTAQWQYNHYFGYTIYMPQNVYVDNFTLAGNTGASFYIVNLYNYTNANVTSYGTAEGSAKCPIVLFKQIKFTNCPQGFSLSGTNGFANSYLGGLYNMSKSDSSGSIFNKYYKTYTITLK